MFQDISQFSNFSDYLPIFTAIVVIELFVLFIFVGKISDYKTLSQWYKQYHIFAIIADVLSVFLGIIIARFISSTWFTAKTSMVMFISIVVVVQWIHDFLFYGLFTSVPYGKNKVFDLFKDYAKEAKFYAILGDSAIMISSVLLASLLANFNRNTNFILLIASLYLMPYIAGMQ